MRYVFIPLPWITGGNPGVVYSGPQTVSGRGSGVISASPCRTRLSPQRGLSGAGYAKQHCLRQRLVS